MVSFATLLTASAALAAPLDQSLARRDTVAFARRDKCEIIDFQKLVAPIDDAVDTLLTGLTNLTGEVDLVNKLVGDLEGLLGILDVPCLAGTLNGLLTPLENLLHGLEAAL